MSNQNTVSVSFTTEEIKKMKDAIAEIASVLNGKTKSLTPTERKTFGRVKYEKEVWIDKAKLHMDSHPSKIPPYVDKAEFDKDYTAHKQLSEVILLLEAQLQQMVDTNILLGYDLDIVAHIFYRVIKTAAENNDTGADHIYQDLKQQFPGKKKKQTPEEK